MLIKMFLLEILMFSIFILLVFFTLLFADKVNEMIQSHKSVHENTSVDNIPTIKPHHSSRFLDTHVSCTYLYLYVSSWNQYM